MSFYAFADNETLTAEQVNDYLMGQAVVRVADVTERDAIPAPANGMVVWRQDAQHLEVQRGVNGPGGTGNGWWPFAGPELSGTINWNVPGLGVRFTGPAASSDPVIGAPAPLSVVRSAGVVTVRGAVRNTGALQAGVNQEFGVVELPTGFRPPAGLRHFAPGMITVADQFLAAGVWSARPDGQLVFQTTNSFTVTEGGRVTLYLGALTYRAA